MSRRHLGIFTLLCTLAAACSDGGNKSSTPDPSCATEACSLDGGTGIDAGKRDAAPAQMRPFFPDSGTVVELQAKVQVNGANTACGSCSVVIAQAQGGVLPYKYEWNDPSLVGPGPHQVCPDSPRTYTVTVTDSSELVGGEFAKPADQVAASGETACVEGDAGDGIQGCVTNVGGGDAGADSGVSITCAEPNDAGVTFDLATGALGTVTVSTFMGPNAFKAGQSYEYSHDRLIPLTLSLGEAIAVDVYGATEPCALEEKLFTLTYDLFTWHQSFCITPKKDYSYLIVAVHLNGALFSWEFLTAGTVCQGCSMTQP
jgi:hypothetical protein